MSSGRPKQISSAMPAPFSRLGATSATAAAAAPYGPPDSAPFAIFAAAAATRPALFLPSAFMAFSSFLRGHLVIQRLCGAAQLTRFVRNLRPSDHIWRTYTGCHIALYRGSLLYFAMLTPRRGYSGTTIRRRRNRGNRRSAASFGRCRRYRRRDWHWCPCRRRRLHCCLRYGLYRCARCRLSRYRCSGLWLLHDRRHTKRADICTWHLPCLLRCLLYRRRRRHHAARRRYGRTGRNSRCRSVGLDGGRSMSLCGGGSCNRCCRADAGRVTGRFCRRYRWTFRHSLLRISCANLGKIAFAVQKRLHRRRGYGTHWCYARWTRCGRLPRRRRGGRFGNGLLRCAGGFCVAWKYLFRCARHGSGRLYRCDGQSGRGIRSMHRHDRRMGADFRLRCTHPSEIRG